MNKSVVGAWLVGAFIGLLLVTTYLLLQDWRGEALFEFPLEPGLRYELAVQDAAGQRSHATLVIEDQDGRDLEPAPGRYRVRIPNPEGLDLVHELRPLPARPEGDRLVELPANLPQGPFTGAAEPDERRLWATLGTLAGRLQGDDAGGQDRGRVVDLSDSTSPSPIGTGCNAVRVAVRRDGEAVAVAHISGGGMVVEVLVRDAEGRFRQGFRRHGISPPADPTWEGHVLWLLEVVGDQGLLLRWEPAAEPPPEERARVPGARCLLAAGRAVGGFWLCGAREGDYLFVPHQSIPSRSGVVETMPFESHPSLSHLPHYLASQDAFLLLDPALDREGSELVLRDRRGRWARSLGELPDSVTTVAASADLGTWMGIERCSESGR